MPRDNILLGSFPTPKTIQLPNGQVFFAKYQRVGWAALPQRVRNRRTYQRKIGPRNKWKLRRRRNVQVGSKMATQDPVSTAFKLGKRVATSNLSKIIIKESLFTYRRHIKN